MALISANNLTIGYGSRIIQQNLTFDVEQGDIFILMGGSGCGKSTLLRALMGLLRPQGGSLFYGEDNFWEGTESGRAAQMRKIGVLFQSGALFSSRTLIENVALPLEYYTKLSKKEVAELAALKLSLVGLGGFEYFYPSEISGGMRKRAGLARALALDPEIVFFDEPSAGLDPPSSAMLDELILELRTSLHMTAVVVTHELASIFAIGDKALYLDNKTKTMLALGPPKELLKSGPPSVQAFLERKAQ